MTTRPSLPLPIEDEVLGATTGIRHGFFTRAGGVSEGIYASLNCGPGSKDEAAHVATNRARVAAHLGGRGPDHLVTPWQVHSAIAVVAEGPWQGERPKADGIVTRVRGLAVGVLTADCAPVLFADGEAGVVGAAHAGWRGAIGGVIEATVAAMEDIGARRARIVAALGPAIGPAAYEVGPDFESELLAKDAGYRRYLVRPDASAGSAAEARAHFDLPSFVLDRLGALGLGRVSSAHRCTYENESLFFSYRRTTHRGEADYGRQISAIVLR
ncbi:MAG: peptidoglycan editing factor PgeF [Hyphomicrobiaceae bacterium]